MGMILAMKCGCGYSADIVIGSGMRGGRCSYPHFCDQCGVVNVNVYADQPSCPKCSSTHVIIYGEIHKKSEFTILNVRVPKFDIVSWVHDERVTRPRGAPCESWASWRISIGDHLCPGCSKMTLRMSRDRLGRFD
jgi:hypothetical protein